MQKGSLQSGNTVLFIPPHTPHSAAILSPFLLETERKAHYLKKKYMHAHAGKNSEEKSRNLFSLTGENTSIYKYKHVHTDQ